MQHPQDKAEREGYAKVLQSAGMLTVQCVLLLSTCLSGTGCTSRILWHTWQDRIELYDVTFYDQSMEQHSVYTMQAL